MDKLLSKKVNEKVIMLGNEAVVRGALEAGVNFVSTYPGTPASEIGNIFAKLTQDKKYLGYFEFSTNERIALEAGIGASFAGLKTLVAMKNFGLNVALDPLIPFIYTGTVGPTVIVVADDPGCHSSAQSEENSRFIAMLGHVPVLEPGDVTECKDFVKLAFKLSEEFKLPVILRLTTRVAHQSAVVKLGNLAKDFKVKTKFIKDQNRFVTMPPRVLAMKEELLVKIEKIKKLAEKAKENKVEKAKGGDLAIITSGVAYLYVKEALKELKLDLPVLKLAFFYPLPEAKIKSFIKNYKKVLVVEELEPYLEQAIIRLAKEVNVKLEVGGKNLLPQVGELRPEIVTLALSKFAKVKYEAKKVNKTTLKHLPRFCPGCPYWQVFTAVKKVAPKDTIFGGDIGCYMLGSVAPHNLYDYLLSMGSGIGIGHGINKATKQKAITFIGDSTFFHGGIPSLINTVFNKSNTLLIILDNGTTAMTGHQPHPGTAVKLDGGYEFVWEKDKPIKIEAVVRACGVKHVKVVDAFNQPAMEKALVEFLPKKETAVIIARGLCALFARSIKK